MARLRAPGPDLHLTESMKKTIIIPSVEYGLRVGLQANVVLFKTRRVRSELCRPGFD